MKSENAYRWIIIICILIVLTCLSSQISAKASAIFNPSNIGFREFANGLTAPVDIINAGDGSGRIFVVEQTGRIRIIKNGILLATPFLDIQSLVQSGGEKGLLSLAFHPSYSTNGEFFIFYNAPRAGDAGGSNLVLEKFQVSAGNPDQADPGSGVILLLVSHPTNPNHNGGSLRFGPDGYLYWSIGDGGSGGDPPNNAQNLSVLLGKILRLDVDHPGPGLNYGIPASNPFFSNPNPDTKKIWAYGLRNPWRFSFDRQTGDIFIGDVGQSAREEIDFQSATSTGGENYGWRVMEGTICYNPPSGCDQSGKVLPITDYDHSLGCAVTGGYIYRGSLYPPMQGHYFYSDICSGIIFSLFNDPANGWAATQLVDTPYAVSTFGEDEQGELYFTDYGAGKVYQMCYGATSSPSCIPPTISGNAGVGGTTLSYLERTVKTVIADGNGNYSITVPYGWSGTVTPSKTGYNFDPVNKSYIDLITDKSGENYSVPPVTYDNFDVPNVIPGVPYSDQDVNTIGSSTAIDDPSIGNCNLKPGLASIWYSYIPSANQEMHLDTFGSSFDTLLAVWIGSRGSLSPVVCNDDSGGTTQSSTWFNANAGTTYYIEVAQWNGLLSGIPAKSLPPIPGGTLQFHVTSFGDVPGTGFAWNYIEGLFHAGITGGCSANPRNYCPDSSVTRAQMAVFLLRGIHNPAYTPPAATGTIFADVPLGNPYAAWIERLAAEGITSGCGGGNYCPNSSVTRAQMAVFLLRAEHTSAYVPPAATGTIFADVPLSNPYVAWIERLAAEGITGGCGGGNYCPNKLVTRAQIAVFLVRVFALPLP